MDGDGRGRKLASRYGQRAHRRPDIYRSSGRLACDGFWCFWCKHPRFCHNGNNGRHIVTNKRLQFSSLSCLGQPQWGGVRSGTYLATLHHLSRQFCMTFNLTLRVFRAWTGGSTAGATNPAGLPAVTGEASWTRGAGGEPATTNSAGAFRVTLAGSTTTNAVSGAGDVRLDFDASWSNPIYGASPTVMPASVDLPVCLYLGLRA